MVKVKVDAMRVRHLVGAILVLAASALRAGDGGGTAETQRARAAALETLIAAKQASIQAAWKDLAAADAQLALLRPEPTPAGDNRDADTVSDLLVSAEKRQILEERRLRLLRDLGAAYSELGAAQGLLSESKAKMRRSQQVLDGHWVLTQMPSGLHGDLYLDQTGTLLSGEYRLENGQTGNVQGTFVNGQLILERIDSQYGRIGRYEAVLSKDQNALRGTWYSYEVSSGQPLVGALAADRAPDAEETAP